MISQLRPSGDARACCCLCDAKIVNSQSNRMMSSLKVQREAANHKLNFTGLRLSCVIGMCHHVVIGVSWKKTTMDFRRLNHFVILHWSDTVEVLWRTVVNFPPSWSGVIDEVRCERQWSSTTSIIHRRFVIKFWSDVIEFLWKTVVNSQSSWSCAIGLLWKNVNSQWNWMMPSLKFSERPRVTNLISPPVGLRLSSEVMPLMKFCEGGPWWILNQVDCWSDVIIVNDDVCCWNTVDFTTSQSFCD